MTRKLNKNQTFIGTLLCLAMVFSICFTQVTPAATISDHHTAQNIRGGQTVYITSNGGWNYFLYPTIATIQLTTDNSKSVYQRGLYDDVNVKVYKYSGNTWKLYKTANCKCNYGDGKLNTSFKLEGQSVKYKIVITPIVKSAYAQYFFYKSSDVTGIKLGINYGNVTKVQ